MFDALLSFFGLVRISRAENATATLHGFYASCVVAGVQTDFNVPPSPTYAKTTDKWWREEFRNIIKINSDDIEITTGPYFLDKPI